MESINFLLNLLNSNAGIWAFLGLVILAFPLLRLIFFFIEEKLNWTEKKIITSNERGLRKWSTDEGTFIRMGHRVYNDSRREKDRYLKAFNVVNKKGYFESSGSECVRSSKGDKKAQELKDSWLSWLRKI